MAQYAAAIDQGTTSTRFMVFDHGGQVVSVDQKEHEQIYPKPGWVEHDAMEIWERTQEVVRAGLDKRSGIRHRGCRERRTSARRPSSGIASTGQPVHNAIVWQDTRTDQIVQRAVGRRRAGPVPGEDRACRSRRTSPVRRSGGSSTTSTGVRARAESGDVVFGNIDTWVIWHAHRRADGGAHVTDVTNASRTMMMNLETLDWDDEHPRDPGRSTRDAARDPGLERRRTASSQGRLAGSPDRRGPRRPAGCARSDRPASRSARRRTPTARATSCCSTPERGRPVQERPADDGRATRSGDQPATYCAGRRDRDHGCARPVAARQHRPHQAVPGGRGRSRRRWTTTAGLLRPGVLGALRPVLAD